MDGQRRSETEPKKCENDRKKKAKMVENKRTQAKSAKKTIGVHFVALCLAEPFSSGHTAVATSIFLERGLFPGPYRNLFWAEGPKPVFHEVVWDASQDHFFRSPSPPAPAEEIFCPRTPFHFWDLKLSSPQRKPCNFKGRGEGRGLEEGNNPQNKWEMSRRSASTVHKVVLKACVCSGKPSDVEWARIYGDGTL